LLIMDQQQREDKLEEEALASRHRPDERPPNAEPLPPGSAGGGVHATGSPGGGTAIGGMAGTNIGDSSVEEAELEEAHGSGNFDVELAAEDQPPYSGISGGAVGGTPAEKRSEGGTTRRGIAPRETGHDSTVGSNAPPNKPR
jgi:hypothetical protein